MREKKSDPIRPTDDEARTLARRLIREARFTALGVLDPETHTPVVTRVGVGTGPDGQPVTLVSTLAQHTTALRANPACSILLGEPGVRGDPLTHPRLTLVCRAHFVARSDPQHVALRSAWMDSHPKAKLYIGFADFGFVRFETARGLLNGGFGQAYILTPDDLLDRNG